MALPNIFTQTPIEAALWTAAVSTQAQIASMIRATPLFWGAISLAIGLAAIAFLFRLGTSISKAYAVSKFATFLFCTCVGLAFLSYQNASPFSPVNARGTEWRSVPRVAANPKYHDLQNREHGLLWYTTIHRGLIEVAGLLTSVVGYIASDPLHKDAPQYLVNAMAATARVSIDDPAIERGFDELVSRCSDTKQGQILGATSSLKSVFNLADPWCQTKYTELTSNLKAWARAHRPRTLSITENSLRALNSLGILTESDIDNKMIASAVKNYARIKAGETKLFHNTNDAALVDQSDFWVNVTKGFSASNFLSSVNAVRNIFGGEPRDLEGAAVRNEAAVVYNQMLAFLPAARGFAKAIIAYLFIFASLALCVGISGYFWGWLKMAAIFTMYEPLSSALYYFMTKFIVTTANIKAMDSLKLDPLVLAGADVIDGNLARMEAVYFCVQVGLLLTVAIAGIRAFGTLKNLRHSYVSDLFQSVTHPVTTIGYLTGGFTRT